MRTTEAQFAAAEAAALRIRAEFPDRPNLEVAIDVGPGSWAVWAGKIGNMRVVTRCKTLERAEQLAIAKLRAQD